MIRNFEIAVRCVFVRALQSNVILVKIVQMNWITSIDDKRQPFDVLTRHRHIEFLFFFASLLDSIFISFHFFLLQFFPLRRPIARFVCHRFH